MKSNRKTILEAYNKTLGVRSEEKTKLEEGQIVEDFGGNRFKVLAFSEKFEDVEEYDSTSSKNAILSESKEDTIYVALEDKYGTKMVSVYGDSGVSFVIEQEKPEYTKKDNDIMSAFYSVVNEAKETNDGDDKVESEVELKEFAMKLAKAAFGDEVDKGKIDSLVKNAIEKSGGDWKKASGIVAGSFNS